MSYFIEIRRTVERTGPLRYVPLASQQFLTGFRSVYAVDAALRDLILARDSVAGLREFPVYSDCLFVDYDSDVGSAEFAEQLMSDGLAFDLYKTGRRGCHFHIPVVTQFGLSVPQAQLAWAEAHIPGDWDRTIYRPAAIIRLPGTWHEKSPGHCKELAHRNEGRRLEIPTQAVEVPRVPNLRPSSGRNEADFWSALLSPQRESGRTFKVFHLGALASECGLAYEPALEATLEWAHTVAIPPLTDEREIQRVFDNGFNKR